MILRRIIAHLRKQEWTAIAIDFVIVVLGVFLGIQVSNWNQAAADRRAESAYLSQLQGDLQSSGNLEIISDPELRAAIITYFFSARRLEAVIDKNNGYFVDEGFVAFMREQGLPARPWDDQVMGVRVPSVGRTDGPFEDEVYGGRLFLAPIPALTNAPNASAWAPVASQLSWRGLSSVGNESTARRLLDATNALEARIADRLDGGRS